MNKDKLLDMISLFSSDEFKRINSNEHSKTMSEFKKHCVIFPLGFLIFSFNTEIRKETFINTFKLGAEVLDKAQNVQALEKAADRIYEKLYLKAYAHEDGKVTESDLKELKIDEDYINDTRLIFGDLD